MNVNTSVKMNYDNISSWRFQKNKAKLPAFVRKSEARNPKT